MSLGEKPSRTYTGRERENKKGYYYYPKHAHHELRAVMSLASRQPNPINNKHTLDNNHHTHSHGVSTHSNSSVSSNNPNTNAHSVNNVFHNNTIKGRAFEIYRVGLNQRRVNALTKRGLYDTANKLQTLKLLCTNEKNKALQDLLLKLSNNNPQANFMNRLHLDAESNIVYLDGYNEQTCKTAKRRQPTVEEESVILVKNSSDSTFGLQFSNTAKLELNNERNLHNFVENKGMKIKKRRLKSIGSRLNKDTVNTTGTATSCKMNNFTIDGKCNQNHVILKNGIVNRKMNPVNTGPKMQMSSTDVSQGEMNVSGIEIKCNYKTVKSSPQKRDLRDILLTEPEQSPLLEQIKKKIIIDLITEKKLPQSLLIDKNLGSCEDVEKYTEMILNHYEIIIKPNDTVSKTTENEKSEENENTEEQKKSDRPYTSFSQPETSKNLSQTQKYPLNSNHNFLRCENIPTQAGFFGKEMSKTFEEKMGEFSYPETKTPSPNKPKTSEQQFRNTQISKTSSNSKKCSPPISNKKGPGVQSPSKKPTDCKQDSKDAKSKDKHKDKPKAKIKIKMIHQNYIDLINHPINTTIRLINQLLSLTSRTRDTYNTQQITLTARKLGITIPKPHLNIDSLKTKEVINEIKEKLLRVLFNTINKENEIHVEPRVSNSHFVTNKYYIGRGNNPGLVRNLFKQRWWWATTDREMYSANLLWTQWRKKKFLHLLPSLKDKEKEKEKETNKSVDQLQKSEVSLREADLTPTTATPSSDEYEFSTDLSSKNDILSSTTTHSLKHQFSQHKKASLQSFSSSKKTGNPSTPSISTTGPISEHPPTIAHTNTGTIPSMPSNPSNPDSSGSFMQMHNHIEGNIHLGNKKAMFLNMKNFYASLKDDIFNSLPVTFHIRNGRMCAEFERFKKYFEKEAAEIKESRRKAEEEESEYEYCDSEEESDYQEDYDYTGKAYGRNVWIVKPGENSNRGNGIQVYKKFADIQRMVGSSGYPGAKHTYIVQKYIERPLLIHRRKFDIRCFTLMTAVNGFLKGYFYQEGYLRTSSKVFTLNNLQSKVVHLTNEAVQKKYDDFGKFEPGNKVFLIYLLQNFRFPILIFKKY